MTQEAFICDAIRTPFGRYGGALSTVRTDDLAAGWAARGWRRKTGPIANLELIANPEKQFLVIMKDGTIYKNTMPK
jgi:acetyl-CoA acetyltransferase